MIHPHTDLKFRVSITSDGFSQNTDPWNVKIIDYFGREFYLIRKEDCFRDSIGNWYFLMPNVLTGRYYAITTVQIPDEDFNDGYMNIVDKQKLVEVGLHGHCKLTPCKCEQEGVDVEFTRMFTKSLDGAEYLADKDGNYIYTSDGKRIQFMSNSEYVNYNDNMAKVQLNMTGEEFKKLIEGNEPNSQVNTIPEVIRVLEGISDETTVKQEIQDETEETYVEEEESLYLDGQKPEE